MRGLVKEGEGKKLSLLSTEFEQLRGRRRQRATTLALQA